ncbi:MAG TPA: ATP-binding protein [Thermoanaerobaculia bacterium]|nr:ATP-binding protein [Thermoanaerobaculia bacterium]
MARSAREGWSPLRGAGALSIQRRVAIGFVASALLVLLLTATSTIALRMALATDREAIRQAEDLLEVGLLRSGLERRVASFRGYLLMGEARFLDKLVHSRTEVVASLQRLRQRVTAEDAGLLEAVERADRGYEEAAAAGLALLRGGASPQELGRYVEQITSPRHDALDRALGDYLAHKRSTLRAAEWRAARENLWASGLIIASGVGALLLLLALAVPVSRRLAGAYEIEHRQRERAEGAEREQRRIAEVLRHLEARKSAVLETALEGIVTIDEGGKLVEFNPSAERIFGYRREEVLGRAMADLLIPERLRDAHHAGLERHLRTGEARVLSRRLEMPALRSDGTEFLVELTITRIATSPPFFTGFVRDISAAKAADRERAELLDREQRARAEAEAAQRRSAFLAEASSVLASSLDYRATLATVARLAVPGMADWCVVDVVDREGKLQRLAAAHVDPAKVAWVSELRERYPEDPKSPYGAAEVLRTGNAQVLTEIPDSLLRQSARDEEHYRILSELGLSSFLSVPLEAAGRRFGVLTLVSAESGMRYGPDDVAFARRLAHHASLAIDNSRLYEEAQAAVAARDDFLSIASHELKTPVATLQLLVQNLLRRFRTEPSAVSTAAASERLVAVDKQVMRLTKLINDLLDLSRITDGRMELDLETADLASIVRDVVARHEEDARRAHCTISVAVESPALGVWDPMRVDQVVENLLSNAIKYGARGRIEVRVDGDERVARLMVRDEGIGIAAEAQARIFQRFERAVSASDYGGFGLGLWIVHQIVAAHGGELRVESEPGRGSAFHVALPRTPPEPEPPAPEAPGYTGRTT